MMNEEVNAGIKSGLKVTLVKVDARDKRAWY